MTMSTQPTELSRSFRIHTAMVLFALEEALGTFVITSVQDPTAIPQSIRTEIERRLENAGFVPVSQIVQETYLREVIELAVIVSKDRSENDAMRRLRELANALDIYDIRNAVWHPNRSFPDFFWFRIAAIASDPSVEQARLSIVTDALHCALDNRLSPPPEGW
ncbi:MAG TPA: hypothetical protein VHD85_20075, partial [Terracidiphilus sp.]|nr:hypothetical protein [Terracidiphilus sp.]